MRIALPVIALVLTTGAAPAPEPVRPVLPTPMLEGPPGPGEAVCRDTIHEVREERGLPELEDKTANADEPLFIAAVDKRIDGCAVLQMHNDINDLRPLPSRPSGPPRLQPAD